VFVLLTVIERKSFPAGEGYPTHRFPRSARLVDPSHVDCTLSVVAHSVCVICSALVLMQIDGRCCNAHVSYVMRYAKNTTLCQQSYIIITGWNSSNSMFCYFCNNWKQIPRAVALLSPPLYLLSLLVGKWIHALRFPSGIMHRGTTTESLMLSRNCTCICTESYARCP